MYYNICSFSASKIFSTQDITPVIKITDKIGENLQVPRREGTPSQSSEIPRTGRLKFFLEAWQKVTNNNLILNIIKFGLKLQFVKIPPKGSLPTPCFSNARSNIINKEVLELLQKSAIKEIAPNQNQFVSPIFDVPKKDSKNRRVILNLKVLNTYIVKTKFKLEGFATISSLISKGDFLVSIDLTDAYLMFSMHEETLDYLCFDWRGTRYAYQCMPFGLTSAPRIFTKVLKVVLVFLRNRGIKASAWFDDIIISANSISRILEQLMFTKLLLKSLGFIINTEKSSLSPSQRMPHLGYIWDTVSFSLSVPKEKVLVLKQKCTLALSKPVSLRFLQEIIGTIEAFRTAFPYAALHYRGLQKQVALNKRLKFSWDKKVSPSTLARKDLNWWISCPNDLPPKPLTPFSPEIIITTDSSSRGWGAFTSLEEEVYGPWSETESSAHNNILETRAVLFSFQSLFKNIKNKSILIRSDNSNTVSYINNQGGRSSVINKIIFKLYEFCIFRNIRFEASFLAGKKNDRADALSRRPRDHVLSLNPDFFNFLCKYLNIFPTIDLFASRLNNKVPKFFSEGPDPLSSGINAFSLPWPDKIYAFPPIKLISKFLSHFISNKISLGLIITPFWPAQPFFPILLDLLIEHPIIFSAARVDACQSRKGPRHLSLFLASSISFNLERRMAFREKLPFVSSRASILEPCVPTCELGESSPIGAIQNRLVLATFQ